MVTSPSSGLSVRDGLLSSEPTLAAPIKEQDASYENANVAAVMLEKLACLDVTRKAERERRREESRAAADPRESVARFLTNFATRHHNVEDALRHMRASYQSQQQHQPHEQPSSQPGARQQPQANPDAPKPEPLAVSTSNPDNIQASLELVSAEALSLEQAAASASYYLPAYDQKQCAAAVAALRASIESTRAALVPRRRFAFGSKKVSKVRGEELSAAAAAPTPPSACTEAINGTATAAIPCISSGPSATFELDGLNRAPHPHPSAPAALKLAESSGGVRSLGMVVRGETSRSDDHMDTADQVVSVKTVSDEDRALVARGRGLLGRTDATVVMTAEEISERGAGGDFVLLDLTRCRVVLLGRLRALRMSGLRDCTVVSGPVTGACFVDDVRGSSLSLATYQVRVHRTHATDLFLRVRSNPIIEHSTGIRVAPWAAMVAPEPRLEQLLQVHMLGEETGCWQQVDDFGWIKAVHSPNWRLLQPKECPQELMEVPAAVWGQHPQAGEQHSVPDVTTGAVASACGCAATAAAGAPPEDDNDEV